MNARAQRLAENKNWMRIMTVANEAYPDDMVLRAWEDMLADQSSAVGDSLAEFVVCELSETFDEEATFKAQCEEAARVMVNAKNELLDVYEAMWLLGLGADKDVQ